MQPSSYSDFSVLPVERIRFLGIEQEEFQASFALGKFQAPEQRLQGRSRLAGILHVSLWSYWDTGNLIFVLFTP